MQIIYNRKGRNSFQVNAGKPAECSVASASPVNTFSLMVDIQQTATLQIYALTTFEGWTRGQHIKAEE